MQLEHGQTLSTVESFRSLFDVDIDAFCIDHAKPCMNAPTFSHQLSLRDGSRLRLKCKDPWILRTNVGTWHEVFFITIGFLSCPLGSARSPGNEMVLVGAHVAKDFVEGALEGRVEWLGFLGFLSFLGFLLGCLLVFDHGPIEDIVLLETQITKKTVEDAPEERVVWLFIETPVANIVEINKKLNG
jgi:hypothetical protein